MPTALTLFLAPGGAGIQYPASLFQGPSTPSTGSLRQAHFDRLSAGRASTRVRCAHRYSGTGAYFSIKN